MNLEVIHLSDIPKDMLTLIMEHLRYSRDILYFSGVCTEYYRYVNILLRDSGYLKSWLCRVFPTYYNFQSFEELAISYIFESLDIYSCIQHAVLRCKKMCPNINVLELLGSLKFQNLTMTQNVLVYLECNNQYQAKSYWLDVCRRIPPTSSFYTKVAEICVRKNLLGFAKFGIDNLNYNLLTEAIRQGNLGFYQKKFLKTELLAIQIVGDLAITPSIELFETECISKKSRILENISPSIVLPEIYKRLILIDDVTRLQRLLCAKRYKKYTYKYILNTLGYCSSRSMCLPILIHHFRPVYISHVSKIIDILVQIGAPNYIKLLPLPIHIC